MPHEREAFPDNDPVLAVQLHHVGDRGQRGELEQRVQLRGRDAGAREQDFDQFIRDRRAAEFAVRVGAVGAVRVHDRTRGGQHVEPLFPEDFMMIRNDGLHSQLRGMRQRTGRADAVVAGHDQADPVGRRAVDDAVIDPVAVPDPFGDVPADVRADARKSLQENICRADAVDVIVPDDADLRSAGDVFLHRLTGFRHVFHEQRIVHRFAAAEKIGARLVFRHRSAVPDQPGGHGIDPERLRDRFKVRALRFQDPFFSCHFSPPAHRVVCFFSGVL